MFGSCFKMRLKAREKEAVSVPTSRWPLMHLSSRCKNPIGPLDGNDVLGPIPVDKVEYRRERGELATTGGPRNRFMLRPARAGLPITSGRFKSSNLGTPNGMKRMMTESEPRWLNAFTRKRSTPVTV